MWTRGKDHVWYPSTFLEWCCTTFLFSITVLVFERKVELSVQEGEDEEQIKLVERNGEEGWLPVQRDSDHAS